MKITCNRPGGFGLHGLILRHGENEVDPALWEENKKKLPPGWLEDLTTPKNGKPAEIVVVGAPAGPPAYGAAEKVALVKECNSLDGLAKLAEAETRKTVLAAIKKRTDELGEAPRSLRLGGDE